MSWLFGYGKNNFVYKIIKNALNYKEIKIVDDEFSSPTDTISLVNFILKVLKKIYENKKIKYGIYHFNSYERKISRFTFANMIIKILQDNGYNTASLQRTKSTDKLRPKNSFLISKKIKKHFIINKKSFKNNLIKMINYYLKDLNNA